MTLDEAILKLVADREITEQALFLDLLKRAGHAATQPTLSRHLKKLGIQKVAGRYQHVETLAPEIPPYTLIHVPPNLLILKTLPGHAQLIGYRVDAARVTGLVGTVAGDDTVLLAVTGVGLDHVEEAVKRLLSTPPDMDLDTKNP